MTPSIFCDNCGAELEGSFLGFLIEDAEVCRDCYFSRLRAFANSKRHPTQSLRTSQIKGNMITFTEYLETVDSDQGTKDKLHEIERLLQETLGNISHPSNHRDFGALVMKELGDKSLLHTILSCWYRVEGPIFHSSDNPDQIYPDKSGRFRK